MKTEWYSYLMKNPIKKILLLLSILLTIILLLSFIIGYEATLNYLTTIISPHKRTFVFSKISKPDFIYLQFIFLITAIIPLFLLNHYYKTILPYLRHIFKSIIYNLKTISLDFVKTDLKIVILIPILVSFFSAFHFPVSHDEAATYLNFTVNSPLTIITSYPAPNNHILHSLLTRLFNNILFIDPLVRLRASSLLVSIVTYLISFSLLKRKYSENVALAIVGIFSVLFMSIYYSYMSRGYGLITLFFIISLFSIEKILSNNGHFKHWIIFCICSILGFYTMPSYLYPYIILNIIVLISNSKLIYKQFIYNLFIIISVLTLYSPIIIFEGLDQIVNNEYVNPIPRNIVLKELPVFFTNASEEITGFGKVIVISLLLFSIIIFNVRKKRFEAICVTFFFLFPIIILYSHSVIPFPRTFNYYAFLFVLFPIISIDKELKSIPKIPLLICIIFLQIILSINFFHKIRTYSNERFNFEYSQVNRRIIGNNSYFINCHLFPINFLFEIRTNNYEMTKYKCIYPPVDEISADSIFGFDYIIIDKDKDMTKVKYPYLSNYFVNVYSK